MAWNAQASIDHLTSNATESPGGNCARAVREAVEQGGVTIQRPLPRPGNTSPSACDYGAGLLKAGFQVVHDTVQCERITFKPVAGDIAVYEPIDGHPHGHMQMFNGAQWLSDFRQKNGYTGQAPGLYPGESWKKADAAFKVYRHVKVKTAETPVKLPWDARPFTPSR